VTAVDGVVAEERVDLVAAAVAVDDVVALSPLEVVAVLRAREGLDAGDVVVLAQHPVVGMAVLVDVDRLADPSVAQRVGVGAAVEHVRTGVGVERVVTVLALQRVVATPALEVVRTATAEHRVVAVATGQVVCVRAALNDFDVARDVVVFAGGAVIPDAVKRDVDGVGGIGPAGEVSAGTAAQRVGSDAAVDDVVTTVSVQLVG